MIEKITKRKKVYLILTIIFFLILILNIITPIIADDFGYSLNLDKEHLRGIKDIINFQIVHYRYWGGRSVAHSLVQLFLFLPKWIFNIFNSLCYLFLTYLIYNIGRDTKKDQPLFLILISLLLYFIPPVFGQDILWLTGSCNYLWTTTIVIFLISLYFNSKKDNQKSSFLLFILGIIAGWTNENTAFGLIVILSTIIILRHHEKKKINSWHLSGLIGTIFGFIIMLCAPGNYIRSEAYKENISLISKLFHRFLNCTTGIFTYLFPLLICLIILFLVYKFKKKRPSRESLIFILGTVFTIYPMVLSPTFPERAWFSSIVFLLIAIVILLYNLQLSKKVTNYLKKLTLVGLTFFAIDYTKLVLDLNDLNEVWKYRQEYISTNKNKEEIRFSIYCSTNRKNPLYKQIDISNDPDAWPNVDMENYFKIKRITTKK